MSNVGNAQTAFFSIAYPIKYRNKFGIQQSYSSTQSIRRCSAKCSTTELLRNNVASVEMRRY